MSHDTWISVDEAAELAGVTPGRIRQLLTSGELRGKKLHPRAWLVSRSGAVKLGSSTASVGRPRIGKISGK